MLQSHAFKSCAAPLRSQFTFLQTCRAYSSGSSNSSEAADLDAARQWFQGFNKLTLPVKLAKTTFSRSSGPGGQKTNKTSSKATTVWPMYALTPYVPKVLHQALRSSRYYVSSSDSLSIQCDSNRSQTENEEETHRRLNEEINHIYRHRVPGITSPEQKRRVEVLKKSDNSVRLRMKKIQGDKKRARTSGGSRGDF